MVNRESKYVTPHLQLRERLLSSQCNASFYLSGWELLRLLSGKEYTSQIRPLGCNSDFTTYPLCVRRLITQPLCVCFLACKVEILASNSQIVRKVELDCTHEALRTEPDTKGAGNKRQTLQGCGEKQVHVCLVEAQIRTTLLDASYGDLTMCKTHTL